MISVRRIPSIIARRGMSTRTVEAKDPVSVERIDARIFCLGTEGGNPVTIFASPEPLPETLQQKLAKSCDWESVLVGTTNASSPSSSSTPTMAFFMPSGEEVSFCAHAAIGGALAMGEGHSGSWEFAASMTGDTFSVKSERVEKERNDGYRSRRCRLQMKGVRFEETPLSANGMTTLKKWSDRLEWSTIGFDSSKTDTETPKPVPTNASVARPKTLVRLESVDAVQRAGTPPSDGSFAGACVTLDDSTGVYLYAPTGDVDSYECRQFPRCSGYPEDPATGIAAAALATSLRFGIHGGGGGGNDDDDDDDEAVSPIYDIYQGTAMGRPSLIQVSDLRKEDGGATVSFGLQGRVEIDEVSTIQIID